MSAVLSPLAESIYRAKYSLNGTEEWPDTARRVVEAVVRPYFPDLVEEITELITAKKFMPGGRYLYASGKRVHQVNNCVLLSVEDSREGWASLMQRVTLALMTGAGVGNVYSKLRAEGEPIKGMGGTSTGPLALMHMVNETGRHIRQGGSRRAAIWAGLHWNHPDIFKFIACKDWDDDTKAKKEKDYNYPAPMDGTNISVILDDGFFAAYEAGDSWAHKVYWMTIEKMLTTGEPGFSIDTGINVKENLRNACTELTSEDDNDVCNLGSLNLAQFDDLFDFERAVELATVFLLCGTLYSMLPYAEMVKTREKNRRLGLGLMGIYEWLAIRGKPYAPDHELQVWLEAYAQSTKIAGRYADHLGISRPAKTRALAPNGTIAIIAGTTGGIEPLFAQAYKRRYLKDGSKWVYQYVIDSTTERLVERGLDPSKLETAYELAKDPERRIVFQHWVQQYVDHGISSTLNLPEPDKQEFTHWEFGEMLMKYLPGLRGMTSYPNGSRGGQPLVAVSYEEASQNPGVELEEVSNEIACVDGICGL